MLKQKTMGIVFANMHDTALGGMTMNRTMASVPYGGRYRLIDFPLSAMSNAGITDVGVIVKNNYRSLMDHLGKGLEWDLAVKNGGLVMFPPYSQGAGLYHGRIEALASVLEYLERRNADYVVMSDCNVLLNLDLEEVVNKHIDSGFDITVVCHSAQNSEETAVNSLTLEVAADDTVKALYINSHTPGIGWRGVNIYVMARDMLVEMIKSGMGRNLMYFERDILQSYFSSIRMRAHRHEGYTARIESIRSYFDVNMELLGPVARNALFLRERPVYTKVRDEAPVRYGLESSVKNSLIADGCIIEGEVENSVIFRGVHIDKGAVIKNSIIMQSTVIGENVKLEYVITDKDVVISSGRNLNGCEEYPLYIEKKSKL